MAVLTWLKVSVHQGTNSVLLYLLNLIIHELIKVEV